VILFCGDFRQVTSVIPGGGRVQIISQSFPMSKLWQNFKILKLTENERIKRNPNKQEKKRQQEFAQFLLDIGDGIYPTTKGAITIPNKIKCNFRSISSFINHVFGKIEKLDPLQMNRCLLDRAVLTPLNASVTEINDQALLKMKGQNKIYRSKDRVELDETACKFPEEYLNELEINGCPDHLLKLKIGAPVMVLRNIDPFNSICNGTKGVITSMNEHVLEIEILDRAKSRKGEIAFKRVLIHKISIFPSDPKIAIKFRRHQFPVKLAFAMTINKSQGQTLRKVGVYLPRPCFGHGQLYVAFSRVRDWCDISLFIEDAAEDGRIQGKRKNGEYFTANEVYEELLTSLQDIILNNIAKESPGITHDEGEPVEIDIEEEILVV